MGDEAEKDTDARLSRRLTARAPAGRDPVFRVGVLQKREEDRFRLRSRLVFAAATGLGLAAVAAFVLRPDLAPQICGSLLGIAALAGVYLYREPLMGLARRFSL